MRLRHCLFTLLLLLSAACQSSLSLAGRPSYATVTSSERPASAAVLGPSPTPSAAPPSPALPSPTPSQTSPAPTATLVPPTPTPAVTTLLFTGVIVPARCVQEALDANGNPNYPYEEVRDVIQSADLAVGTFNATMSDFPPHTGCAKTYVLVGSSNNADSLAWAGFDIMSVATNHIKNCSLSNCGDRTFFDTLDNLRRVGILPFGAGANLAEALQPVVVTVNGIRFGFVSLGQIEPMSFAGEDSPGIAVLNSENIRLAVAAARQAADVVIFMPHWGPEDMSVPNWSQRKLAREIAATGVDLIVGNHTHVVQAVQEIDGIPVFYGLGNFVFDQKLRDHRQGVILQVRFEGRQYAGYELVPTHVDGDGRVHLAGLEEAAEILKRIEEAGAALK